MKKGLAGKSSPDAEKLLFQAILDNAPIGIWFIGLDGRLKFVNKTFCDNTGIPEERFLSARHYVEVLPPKVAANCIRSDEQCQAQEGPHRSQEVLPFVDGKDHLLEITKVKVRNRDGQPMGLIGLTVDITERKNAEEGQRRLEEQLRQAQKMEAIGTLAGGVAHDFNNILCAISGYAHLIARESSLEKIHDGYAKEIIASTDRATRLTQSLLAFSRKQSVDLRPINLNEAIYCFKKLLSLLIGEDIKFTVTLAVDDMVVEADRGQIEQVLMNLVANARDAMPKGGSLSIETHRAEIEEADAVPERFVAPGRYGVISVRDSGTGIPPEVVQHIFEPFFTTKEVGKGTGLGLSMVYGIVKKHNGYITVNSEIGTGTIFHVYLPMIAAELQREREPALVELPTGSETVMLVEDDVMVREVMTKILANYGYTVVRASNGDEAIELFRKAPMKPDLVISDVIMPGKNGREVYDILRTIRPQIKMFFVSGYQGDILLNTGVLEPQFQCLPKPVNPADLLRTVRSVLDGHPAGRDE